ncbi:MAG: hypothetical protein ACE5HX_09300, partial [bacterium]
LVDEVTIGSFEHKRSLSFSLLTFRLPAARYEVIPYLLVIREDVPVELLDSLGSGITALNPNYLKMPIKRLGGEFEVTP